MLHVVFSRALNATDTSALMLVPGDSSLDCEDVDLGSAEAGAR